jgi:hypothetical protein
MRVGRKVVRDLGQGLRVPFPCSMGMIEAQETKGFPPEKNKLGT